VRWVSRKTRRQAARRKRLPMVMSASVFLKRFQQIKTYLGEYGDPTPDLVEAFQKVASDFKATYTPEAFKLLLSEDGPVEGGLEDDLTSAFVLCNRDRAQRGSIRDEG
jgi:hypothetical protein